jgi:hypothetical protein
MMDTLINTDYEWNLPNRSGVSETYNHTYKDTIPKTSF